MNQLDIERAKALPLFSGLDDDQFRRVLLEAKIRRFPANTVLFRAGDLARHLHLMLRGTVELYAGESQRECTLLLMVEGDVFMPAATLFEEPYLNSARTLTDASLVLIPAEVAQREFSQGGPFALNLTRTIAGHFRMAARNLIDLRSCSAPVRLGRFLLRLVRHAEGMTIVSLPTSKGKLAARVGMSRETLSRALQTLAEEGLVVRGSEIIVRDREKIERFCTISNAIPAGAKALDVRAI